MRSKEFTSSNTVKHSEITKTSSLQFNKIIPIKDLHVHNVHAVLLSHDLIHRPHVLQASLHGSHVINAALHCPHVRDFHDNRKIAFINGTTSDILRAVTPSYPCTYVPGTYSQQIQSLSHMHQMVLKNTRCFPHTYPYMSSKYRGYSLTRFGAFTSLQLLRLETMFDKNHYVVGQERKDLAMELQLSETQIKIWFQNRRTKDKRLQSEEDKDGGPIEEQQPNSELPHSHEHDSNSESDISDLDV
ncbi:hypothetical protein ACJMK2_005521 [Sinanodonta woodiana]|uniref:Homeobox domain-containing protein n=1 Tax=Sinanodonta woodiana TaxID=1069815 RepID=A0ABD3VRL5_SINWO